MKLKSIVLAMAATGLVVGQAHAFAPADAATGALKIYISGASAQDKGLQLLMPQLCKDTLDTYSDNGVASGSSAGSWQTAFSCTLDKTKITGLAADTKVLIFKRSKGGSGWGVAPVAMADASVKFMGVSSGNCTSAGTNKYNCGYDETSNFQTNATGPDGGMSDVEPALFVGPNVPAGFSAVSKTVLDNLPNVVSTRGGVFGVIVNDKLYAALQRAQNKTVGDFTDAHMPSLSKQQIAGLMAVGGMTDWTQLKVGGLTTALTAVPGVTAPADSFVHICRRVPGSGTQAQFQAKFLANPCVAGGLVAAADSDVDFGPIVTQGEGSGDVETCMNNEEVAGNWAIGIQSTEKNATHAKNYRFIKVDGVAPTVDNAKSNKYFDWAEETMQWRKTVSYSDSRVPTILSALAKQSGKPSIINTINASFNHSFGKGGYMSLNTNGYLVTDATGPVAQGSHAIQGGKVNNCAVPAINNVESQL